MVGWHAIDICDNPPRVAVAFVEQATLETTHLSCGEGADATEASVDKAGSAML
jgi:hypothetical protein